MESKRYSLRFCGGKTTVLTMIATIRAFLFIIFHCYEGRERERISPPLVCGCRSTRIKTIFISPWLQRMVPASQPATLPFFASRHTHKKDSLLLSFYPPCSLCIGSASTFCATTPFFFLPPNQSSLGFSITGLSYMFVSGSQKLRGSE